MHDPEAEAALAQLDGAHREALAGVAGAGVPFVFALLALRAIRTQRREIRALMHSEPVMPHDFVVGLLGELLPAEWTWEIDLCPDGRRQLVITDQHGWVAMVVRDVRELEADPERARLVVEHVIVDLLRSGYGRE